MSKKSSVGIFIVVALIIIAGITLAFDSKGSAPVVQPVAGTPSTPAPATTPVVTTPAPTAGTYTLAQVATHNSQSDCWSTINGGVYNLTSWIGQHPGGAQAILSICGKDGSAAFNDQHGGERRPANELAGFKIGTLAK